jgi:hypothetical protein
MMIRNIEVRCDSLHKTSQRWIRRRQHAAEPCTMLIISRVRPVGAPGKLYRFSRHFSRVDKTDPKTGETKEKDD